MYLLLVLAILFFDRLSKILAVKILTPYKTIPVINGIFHFSLVHNRGAAFGMLKGQLLIFIIAALLAVIMIFVQLRRGDNGKLPKFALCLILAGALGNLYDRIIFGYVIDFLDFRVWPVFNLADTSITIGAILLGWSLLRPNRNPNFQAPNSK